MLFLIVRIELCLVVVATDAALFSAILLVVSVAAFELVIFALSQVFFNLFSVMGSLHLVVFIVVGRSSTLRLAAVCLSLAVQSRFEAVLLEFMIVPHGFLLVFLESSQSGCEAGSGGVLVVLHGQLRWLRLQMRFRILLNFVLVPHVFMLVVLELSAGGRSSGCRGLGDTLPIAVVVRCVEAFFLVLVVLSILRVAFLDKACIVFLNGARLLRHGVGAPYGLGCP